MKSFVIRVNEIKESVELAQRCIGKFKVLGIEVKPFSGTFGDETLIKDACENWELDYNQMSEIWSRPERSMGAFLSHFRLWNLCAGQDETFLILEHDAVPVDFVFELPFTGLLSIGKPSYGKFNIPSKPGVHGLFSKRYLPGAHAYMLKPDAARILIAKAKKSLTAVDVFLNLDNFPWLEELYPWPVEVDESFSTIQNEKGCLAKHAFGQGYKLI